LDDALDAAMKSSSLTDNVTIDALKPTHPEVMDKGSAMLAYRVKTYKGNRAERRTGGLDDRSRKRWTVDAPDVAQLRLMDATLCLCQTQSSQTGYDYASRVEPIRPR